MALATPPPPAAPRRACQSWTPGSSARRGAATSTLPADLALNSRAATTPVLPPLAAARNHMCELSTPFAIALFEGAEGFIANLSRPAFA